MLNAPLPKLDVYEYEFDVLEQKMMVNLKFNFARLFAQICIQNLGLDIGSRLFRVDF